jgi:hypothetical protein
VFFDSRLNEFEFSPPESLVALDADCLGERHIFFRREDDESRRLSGFYIMDMIIRAEI